MSEVLKELKRAQTRSLEKRQSEAKSGKCAHSGAHRGIAPFAPLTRDK